MSADREKVEVRRRDVDITSELFRLQRQKGRRAMAWDVTFELVRATVGAPDSDRYRLVTQKVIEEIVRHLGEVAPETEEEIPRFTAALADPTAVLITTTLVATCFAEQVAGQTGKDLVDEAISPALTRVATSLPTI
jgi:hypothetical protein